MSTNSIVDCSDLYDNATDKLKRLDNNIDKTIQDLAKNVEARGVPKNRVARQVVKELTAREVLSPSRIYEGLGVEYKRKNRKRTAEKTFPQVKNIVKEESSAPQAVLIAASSTGQSEILDNMNGGPDIKLISEEQKRKGMPREEDERLREKEKEISELIKEKDYSREEIAKLSLNIKELEEQLTEKIKQASDLRKENESLKNRHKLKRFRELQEKSHDQPGQIDANRLDKINIEAGKNLEILVGKYIAITQEVVESGETVPVGTYRITIPDKTLVVRIFVDFNRRNIKVELWEMKVKSLCEYLNLASTM